MARCRNAPNIHIIRPVADMDVPGFFEGHQGGCGPANIARFEAVFLGSLQIDLYFNFGYFFLKGHVEIHDAANVR